MRSAAAWPAEARHCLRVGSLGDKSIIEDSQEHFDVLVVQGNLAVSAPQGIATWPLDKPLWIDPITYAFAATPKYLKNRKTGEYKKTFTELAAAFGPPFQLALEEERPLAPADLTGDTLVEVVERVLGWQESAFTPPTEDAKYGARAISPALLTIPFFPLQITSLAGAIDPPWMRANIDAISIAADRRPRERLAAGMLVELDAFDHPNFDALVETYAGNLRAVGISHVWLWVSDHDEVAASLSRASRLLGTIRRLADEGLVVHQAFGGSLSAIALSRGLASVAHGVNYWESKGWEPIASGGLPTARYFHPGLRERLRVPEAVAIVSEMLDDVSSFHDLVCGCAVCRDVVRDDLADFGAFGAVNVKTRTTRGGGIAEFDSPTPHALRLTKTHYLHAKGHEVEQVLAPQFDPVQTLQRDAARHASDLMRTRHLDRWAVALGL